MRNSYIANTHEAAALHSGKQTAVVVKMAKQPEDCKEIHLQSFYMDFDYRHSKQSMCIDENKAAICGVCGYGIDSGGNYIFKTPYQLGQQVYVREKWGLLGEDIISIDDLTRYKGGNLDFNYVRWQSPATMPKSAARTGLKVVGVEVVRVRDLTVEQVCNAGKEYIPLYYSVTVQTYIVDKFGQQAWDENHYIWYFKIELC